MKSIITIVILFLGCLPSSINAQQNQTQHFKIGFSQCTSGDIWRQTMQQEMEYELALYPGLELIIKDANDDSNKQIEDIKELMNEDIDLLIVSPNESKPLTPIIEEIFKKGLPVIIIDRNIVSENYTAFIGADNYQIGKEAGRYAVKLLKGKGKIAEMWGLKGSSPAIERHKGFNEIISKYPEIELVDSSSGEWDQKVAMQVMKAIVQSGKKPDLLFAHNDFMAIGAYEEYSKLKNKDFYILGIDGLRGDSVGVQAVIDKKLDATFLYPTGGDIAIDIAWKVLNNLPYEKENVLQTVVIDSSNASVIKIQTDQIISLQNKINTSKKILVDQVKKFNNQQFLLMVSLVSLILVLILTFLMIRAYRKKNIANKRLDAQRKQVSKQNEELKRISEQLQIATQEKLRFFTNISHEFRTPLTLILGPLDKMIAEGRFDETRHRQLKIMHHNASRLLRLINQLMDLRKIENDKMQLKAGLHDIVSFVKEIKETFNEHAEEKDIQYNFISNIESLKLYFDKDKIDKVLFNLLSNAFKFTQNGGEISVILNKAVHTFSGKGKESIKIEVKDNGRGISETHLTRIFERFYRVEQDTNDVIVGSGLGLTFTKSLVQLHHGDIEVKSKQGEETSFFVYLQTGKNHLSVEDIIFDESDYDKTERAIKSMPDEIDYTPQVTDNEHIVEDVESLKSETSVLIVEDEKDIRDYIRASLSDELKIYEVTNGKEAIAFLEDDEPDLIITDVMMPEMDGLELTRTLKSDIKTCHIPIIMLTARASQEHKIEGLEEGADSYIPKPFNNKHLQVRVKKLIENRSRIRKHYRESAILDETIENGLNKMDRNFLKKTIQIIEDSMINSTFGVEELSKQVGLSRVHLYRKIKHIAGSTPSEFITNVRLQKASVLLLESGKNIAEVAYETGFSSSSYFSKCFKERFKVSPKEYLATQKP